VVLDLDNTLCRLDVDWGEVGERLRAVARAAGRDLSDAGIWELMQDAREPGREPLLAEMEQLVTEAELEGASACAHNATLVEWVARESAAPVSILSLNSRRAVQAALEQNGLESLVGHIVGREDVREVKPHPEGMLVLAERHGVEPGRMLLVGDKDGDRKCAEGAGAAFLHVEDVGVEWRRRGA
jgi:phosphoglycolate phosphatase-like HAD superfamily hydrolase